MKKLLIVQHVWGKYTGYIPFFLLFQKIAYPEYDSLIYIYDDLPENEIKQLKIIEGLYNGFTVKKIDKKECLLSEKALSVPQVAKCLRWLMYDEVFSNYQAVYIGDIDIMMCKEEKPLFEAHMEHCSKMNLCYSNMERLPEANKPNSLYSICKDVKKYGPYWAAYFLKNYAPYAYKYSGLHFVKTEPYYKAMNRVIPRYIDELEKMVRLKRSSLMLKNFSNEEFLRTMIIESGIGMLPKEEKYRPYHGLHIGRYREEASKESIDFYKESYDFYKQYKVVKESDVFKDLFELSSDFIKKTFLYMDESYQTYEKEMKDSN